MKKYIDFNTQKRMNTANDFENFITGFYKWKDLFDFSNYSKDSKNFNETNKKVIGKMKD